MERIVLSKNHPMYWDWQSIRPDAFDELKQNPEKIVWPMLSMNPSPEAIDMLIANPDKISYRALLSNSNPKARELLEQNIDKLCKYDWTMLSCSSQTEKIEFLKQHTEHINWDYLTSNVWATEILAQHPDKIVWDLMTPEVYARLLKLNVHIIDCPGYVEFMDALAQSPSMQQLFNDAQLD